MYPAKRFMSEGRQSAARSSTFFEWGLSHERKIIDKAKLPLRIPWDSVRVRSPVVRLRSGDRERGHSPWCHHWVRICVHFQTHAARVVSGNAITPSVVGVEQHLSVDVSHDTDTTDSCHMERSPVSSRASNSDPCHSCGNCCQLHCSARYLVRSVARGLDQFRLSPHGWTSGVESRVPSGGCLHHRSRVCAWYANTHLSHS